ncbi:SusC/RagA family TonB-linked outer membrane protein [Chitinophaga sp. GCM10012297]|uniref:SusC/RagA family TonB-linked outer membrane protein n=1 Tax=Chitinophaga chungangae TaxID=2821488 RepID=A0ABS3YJX4_9BACT|nr:SusC/RagA family TonB-linked outer membrane protein [Chitinophaga chungangae]MBO9154954.1 SusC/RagA family TonB-linked outer membrane protein [Chitinophaga chungangae]
MRSTFSMRTSWLSFLMLLTTSLTYAQSITIKGKVTDAKDNTPLPGVTVRVVGTTTGTSTVTDGSYTISVPNAGAQLEFSYIGYETLTLATGGNTTLNVQLKISSKTLEDVVVVGYGTLKRKEITNAVSSIKAEDFNAGGARSPMDLVQGKVPGLSITRVNGNNPNASASVQMRGIATLSGAVAPLIVIDGVPGGNLDLLQQEDIASIDVLRDGSAAAIYGTRGTGGVILITTQKGRSGDPQYNFASYVQTDAVAKRPEVLSADEYRKLSPANDLGGNTDIYDELINKQNVSQYYTLNASGGTDKSNYRGAVFFNRAEGIAKRNNRTQYGGRLNFNQTGLQGKLTMQANLVANFNKADLLGGSSGDFEQAVQRNPTAPIRNTDGSFIETSAFNNYNPVARLEQEISERDQQTIQGDGKLSLEVLKGLRVSAFGAIVKNTWNDRQYRLRESNSSKQSYEGGGYAYKANRMELDQTFETTVDYNTTINDDHTISAVGGYSYFYNTVEQFSANNSGFLTDAFQDWNLGNGLWRTLGRAGMSSNKVDYKLVAFFARANYAFRQKYFAQLIIRREGSSKFGENNKWANFPAASLGWAISEEDFMKGNRSVNQLKLRVGYGVTGNSGFTSYNSLVLLGTGGAYLQNGNWYETFGPSRNPNPDLRWEKKGEWNVGLDFGLFSNRISGSFDVYQRDTKDLLGTFDTQLPPFVTSSIYTNVGSIRNRGFEIVLSGVVVQKKDFNYTTDITFNRQQNTVLSLSNELYRIDKLTYGDLPSPGNLGPAIRVVEGGPMGNFYGKRFAGFDNDGNWLFYKKDGSKVRAGDINENDLGVIGNGVPKMMFSWNNNLRYKRWDLTLFWRGKLGYDILNLKEMYFGNQTWIPNNVLKSAITKHAALKEPAQYSDYYLEPGGFVKLDNLSLGYNFKFRGNYVRNLRVYAAGRNLVTITDYSGLDPELEDNGATTGIDGRGFYPRTRSYTLGLTLGF